MITQWCRISISRCWDICPWSSCTRRPSTKEMDVKEQLSKETFGPRMLLPVRSLQKSIFSIAKIDFSYFLLEIFISVNYWMENNEFNSLQFVGLMLWTKVPLDKSLLWQLLPREMSPWTSGLLDICCYTIPRAKTTVTLL